MRINVSRGFATELLKDIIFPEVCPVCGDVIPIGRRAALHRNELSDTLDGNGQRAEASRGLKLHENEAHKDKVCDTARMKSVTPDFDIYYRGLICDSCLKAFDFIEAPYCIKCGKRISASAAEELCSDCRSNMRSFIQNRALLSYDERMRDICADIKYNGRKEYIELLGVLAADRLGAWMRETKINCLIPVPIHLSRLKKRGYNQSELLCDVISRLTHIPTRKNILIRSKKTAAQKELNVSERLLNLQNAFEAVRRLPQGSIALIVDDIYTTGSTMEACTECLLKAGAGKVYGLTICIGEDKEI